MAATRCRTLSRPAFSLFKSSVSKPSVRQSPPLSSAFSIPKTCSSTSSLSRPLPQLGSLQSLLPLHTAISSARLTSCLGLDSKARSLSQELGLSVPR
ncbi:OLC1v1029077C1 [Oldenlandia corymbosa var. corymbosa]|uniref:OLC1v1029077C1 n=1 Tax=Oldenlandia corymbosa var. corymbosa TaxID=529605 RepID=A0AAV1CFX1_OLDCO|nr:OLC1v1029077C1 [Oldenlandia corymbosa var. corymbosa]